MHDTSPLYDDTTDIRTTRLPNGALVVSEAMPGLISASVGVWTDAGSIDEGSPENFGQAHVLEHMLFKGTATRSAFQLAEEIENVGGQLNAYTERDTTQLFARTLADHLPLAVELLGDMLCHSAFDPHELERERQVILEEVLKYEALPEERIHDMLTEGLWAGGPLGHPIQGTQASVSALTRAQIMTCWRRHFAANRVVIAAAGRVDHDQLVDLCTRVFADLPPAALPGPAMPQGGRVPLQVLEEDEEQVTFTWGGRTYPVADPRNFPLALADAVLGAGATSRLFQEVREKRGLAYDISSYTVGFKETGLLAIDGAASPATFPQVLELVVREVQRLRADGLTRDELCRAREQLKVGMALALETTNDRMRRLVQHLFTWGEIRPLGYIIRELEAVTLDDTQAAIEEVINPATWSFAAIGPVDEGQVRAALGY